MAEQNSRSYFITGGAGFIGSHLSNKLLKTGNNVTVFDIEPKDSNTFLHTLQIDNKVQYIQGDIRNYHDLEILKYKSFDCVIHLAALPTSLLSNIAPNLIFDINVKGTEILCNVLKDSIHGCLVFASSACAYGIPLPDTLPLKETYPSNEGFYNYSKSKQLAEHIVTDLDCMPCSIARFVNIYGPGDRHFSRIIPRIIRQLIFNKELSLSRTNGETILDFLYVEDAINGIIALENYCKDISPKDHTELFNFGIGPSHAISINDLIQKISQTYDGIDRPINMPSNTIEPVISKYLDCSKAKKYLNWNPSILLPRGLEQTISWYKENINNINHLEDDCQEEFMKILISQ